MDFSLTFEQQALRDLASRIAGDELSAASRIRTDGEARALDGADLKILADTGLFGMLADPREDGTTGLIDAVLVTEAFAEGLVPGGFAGSAIAAQALWRLADSRSAGLDVLGAGTPLAVALAPDLTWPPRAGRGRAWEWTAGSQLVLPRDEGVVVLDMAMPAGEPGVDLLRDIPRWEHAQNPPPDPGEPASRAFLAAALTLTGASLVGCMAGALGLSLAHVRDREQFGRPIGSFQALQQIAADMLVDLEASRSIVYGAAWACEHAPAGEAWAAALAAKAWCAEAGIRVCESAVQLHGGLGYTWECMAHAYLRSAHASARAFLSGGDAARRLAQHRLNEKMGAAR